MREEEEAAATGRNPEDNLHAVSSSCGRGIYTKIFTEELRSVMQVLFCKQAAKEKQVQLHWCTWLQRKVCVCVCVYGVVPVRGGANGCNVWLHLAAVCLSEQF